jgi:hypothetical protein
MNLFGGVKMRYKAKVKASVEMVVWINEDISGNQEVEEIEVVGEDELSLDDLEVEGVEEIVEEEVEEVTDEVETELTEAEAPKAEKKKRTAPTNSPLASIQPIGEDEVGASYIADLCGIDSRELRNFLRKNYRDMENSKAQRYHWKKDDPAIQEIVDAFNAFKNGSKTEEKAPAAQKPTAPATKPTVAQKPVTTGTTVAHKPGAVAQKPTVKK